MKSIVITFGRFNPPTRGHEVIFKKMKELAKEQNGNWRIYLSKTKDKKNNPLSAGARNHYIRCMGYDHINSETYLRTIFDVLQKLEHKRYTHVTIVAGEDRIDEYERKIRPYNGNLFNFEELKFVFGGERNDIEFISSISASKVREYARKNQWLKFEKCINMKHNWRTRMFNDIREQSGLCRLR